MNIQIINVLVAFFATVILGFIIIPKLRNFKVGQMVRDDGPKSHLKKQGTPTMGGAIMILVLIVMLFINAFNNPILILPAISVLGFGIIGFIDDFKKLILKNTKGLSPIKKIIGLFIVSSIFIYLYLNVFNLSTTLIVPFFNIPFHLSTLVYIAFAMFILLATTNAVNLTDGLDGLATGVSAIIMTFFAVVSFNNGDMPMFLTSILTVATCLGFLIFNAHPAKVFMGDTGSLALRRTYCICGFNIKNATLSCYCCFYLYY